MVVRYKKNLVVYNEFHAISILIKIVGYVVFLEFFEHSFFNYKFL